MELIIKILISIIKRFMVFEDFQSLISLILHNSLRSLGQTLILLISQMRKLRQLPQLTQITGGAVWTQIYDTNSRFTAFFSHCTNLKPRPSVSQFLLPPPPPLSPFLIFPHLPLLPSCFLFSPIPPSPPLLPLLPPHPPLSFFWSSEHFTPTERDL